VYPLNLLAIHLQLTGGCGAKAAYDGASVLLRENFARSAREFNTGDWVVSLGEAAVAIMVNESTENCITPRRRTGWRNEVTATSWVEQAAEA
jgi:hypothetical protein